MSPSACIYDLVLTFYFLIQVFNVLAFSHVTLLSNSLVAKDAGRYTQVKIGLSDSLPFMVFNDEKNGGVGVAHCDDPLCNTIKKKIIDPTKNPNNARFIFMQMNPGTKFAQVTYTEQSSDSSSVKFLSCLDTLCTKYHLTTIYKSNNSEATVTYPTFSVGGKYTEKWSPPVVAFSINNTGLSHIYCADQHCTTSFDNPKMIVSGKTGYPSVYMVLTSGYKAGIPIFTYYDEDSGSLNWTACSYPDCPEPNSGVIETIKGNKVGKYNFMRPCNSESGAAGPLGIDLCMIYVNEDTGDLLYTRAQHFDGSDKFTIVDNIGNKPYGVFPELDFYPGLNNLQPVFSYFDTISDTSGSLKFAQCSDLFCSTKKIDTLASGSAGYGRDSSIAWLESHNLMYISFLDFNGGEDKRARLLVLNVTTD